MVVQLIAKNKNEKYQFQGRCKLIIDSLSKLLLVEPFVEDYKMISAMFKWKFVAQKNILFVFAEYDFQDFALIFDNSAKCHKAIGFLLKKGASVGNKEMISQRFLSLFFNDIFANKESNLKIKEILIKWIEFFDGKEKEEFIQILKEKNVYDLFYSNTVGELPKNQRKRKANDITKRKESKIGSISNRLNNKNFKKGCKDKQHNLPVLRKIIEESNFEILKYIQNGRSRIKLSIFPDSNDRKYCYEYYWQESNNCFVCHKCDYQRKCLTAKIIKRNGKDVVQLNETQHVCNLREYKTITEKPNYNLLSYEHGGSISERLIIFLDSSHKFCYEYYRRTLNIYLCCGCYRKQFHLGADICQKEDGTEFIMLKSSNHICEPRKFNSEKYDKKEIVEAPNFKVFNDFQNGIDRSKLVVFTSSDLTMCYEYFLNSKDKKFICRRCQKKVKYVAAELCQNSDGSQYLKLSKMKHVCEPREYDPDKFESSNNKLIECSNFKIFKYKHNGIQASKLIIFCETNKNLCYEFYWNKNNQKYYCSYCPMENRPSATVCQNENSKEYLILNNGEHLCDLREFDPDKYKDDVKIDKSMYDLTTTTARNNKILIIFTSQEKKFYHKFLYCRSMKYFYCSKCYSSLKIHISTATLQNEGKENEFVYISNQKHICDAFESLKNGNIIMAPNYQFVKRKVNGKIHQHLVVFTNDEKSECYEYSWSESNKNFICFTCIYKHKIYVFAKMFKNEENEECIELSSKPHKCQSIKFVPENIPAAKIVKEPDFKLYEILYRGKSCKRLAIIDSKNRNMGYIYCYSENGKKFICRRCKNKRTDVTAKVLQDENGQDYLELNDNEHVCELQKI